MIKLLLVDDDAQVRAGLRMRILLEEDLSVVAEARDARSAIMLAHQVRPDVIVMDVSLHSCECDAVDVIPELASIHPRPALVILTMFDNEDLRRHALALGASALVAKHEPVDALLAAVREAAGAAVPQRAP